MHKSKKFTRRHIKMKTLRGIIIVVILVFMVIRGYETSILDEAFESHDYETVIAKSDEEKMLKKEDVKGLIRLANSYNYSGNHEKALELTESLMEMSDYLSIRVMKSDILEDLNREDEKAEFIGEILENYEDKYDSLEEGDRANYNYFLIENKQPKEAIKNYKVMLEGPLRIANKSSVYNNIAWASAMLDDYESAVEYAKKGIEIEPNDSIIYSVLGNAYFGMESYEEAKEAFLKAVELNEKNSVAVYGLAVVSRKLGEYESAIGYWKRHLELIPSDSEPWYNIKEIYSEQGNKTGQAEALETIVKLENYPYYYTMELMTLYYEMDNEEKAKVVEQAFRDNNDPIDGDCFYADYVFQNVSVDEGVKLYQGLFNTYPYEYWFVYDIVESIHWESDDVTVNKVLDSVERAYGLDNRLSIELDLTYTYDDYEKMLEVANKMLKRDDKNALAYEAIGDSYYFEDYYKEAVPYYLKAIKYGEEPYYVQLAIADCYLELDNLSETKSLLDELISNGEEGSTIDIYYARLHMKNNQPEKAVKSLIDAYEKSEYIDYVFESHEELAPLKEREELEEYLKE